MSRFPTVDDNDNDRLDKLYTDMYFGSGKDNPSVTTRLALIEQMQEATARNVNRALWLAVTTLISVAGELVMKFIH